VINIIRDIHFKSQGSEAIKPATMSIATFSERERKIRGIQSLLLFWSIATISVLIPIAHIILVPSFLIGGVVVAKRRWNRGEEGISAEGDCPSCTHAITIDLEKKAELPQWHHCPQCNDSLEFQAENGQRAQVDTQPNV